jgi:hypothetical protein
MIRRLDTAIRLTRRVSQPQLLLRTGIQPRFSFISFSALPHFFCGARSLIGYKFVITKSGGFRTRAQMTLSNGDVFAVSTRFVNQS